MAEKEKKLDEDQDAGAEKEESEGFSKTILIYGVVIMLSFFASFLFLYFAMIRNQDVAEQKSTTMEENDVHQPAALGDSIDAIDQVTEIVVDSIPQNNLFSTKEKIKILELENVQRQKEIDHLWTVLTEIAAEQKRREQEEKRRAAADSAARQSMMPVKVAVVDTVKKAPPLITPKPKKVVVDSTQFLARRDAAIGSSAKIYSSMKPAKAAVILQGFEPDIAAKILLKMRQRQSAKILEAMKPAQAAKVCQVMVLGKNYNKKKS